MTETTTSSGLLINLRLQYIVSAAIVSKNVMIVIRLYVQICQTNFTKKSFGRL